MTNRIVHFGHPFNKRPLENAPTETIGWVYNIEYQTCFVFWEKEKYHEDDVTHTINSPGKMYSIRKARI